MSAAQTASIASPPTLHVALRDAADTGRVFSAMLLLAVILPFERTIISGPAGLTVTTVEAAILSTLITAGLVLPRAAYRIDWRSPLTRSTCVFLATLLASAVAAPANQGNALRVSARMIVAAAIAFVVVAVIDTRTRARILITTLLTTAVVVAVIAVLEAAQVAPVMSGLTLFRPGFHVVGGQLRASATLFYPTIASMYLEAVFALGLWLLLDSATATRAKAAVFVALTIVAAGIVATFTRAGLIGMAVALLLVGALHWWRTRHLDRRHALLAALAVAVVTLVLASRSPELLLTRFRTEGSQEWYGARYDVPESLALTTGGEYEIPITLVNTGRIAWDSNRQPAFAMSYHWLHADTSEVVQFDGWRTAFTTPVPPGAEVRLPVNVKAPGEPGRYVLVWDVVHEGRAWLSTEGIASARSSVHVTGPPVSEVTTTMARLPEASVRADRWTLWRAALRIAAEHPLLGVGPDNYRLVYGPYAGLPRWDERVTANNMYLEVLAGSGVFGLSALLFLLTALAQTVWRRWRDASEETGLTAATMCAALAVIAGHGLVDSFLTFSTTYVLFAAVIGLGCANANRV